MSQATVSKGPTTAALVRNFSDLFNAEFTTKHSVTSPLALWLLLALLAPSTSGQGRVALERALGTAADDAANRAKTLLERAHPAVAAALHEAVWTRQPAARLDLDRWIAQLPSAVERGQVPLAAVADRWLVSRTGGRVDHFPVPLNADTAVVLASALDVQITWADPFRQLPPSRLDGEFGDLTDSVLASAPTHQAFVTDTSVGLLGVHAAWSTNGLLVLSVIADVDVPPERVHAAASHVCASMLDGTVTQVDPFDMPLGRGPAWSVSQDVAEMAFAPSHRDRSSRAVLAPWEATSDRDLRRAPGVPKELGTSPHDTRPDTASQESRLSAAGAASAVYYTPQDLRGVPPAPMRPHRGGTGDLTPVTRRRLTLMFSRPYAVLGVARSVVPDAQSIGGMTNLGIPEWDGVPVFSAWVTSPAA